jgi:hypothetical protein
MVCIEKREKNLTHWVNFYDGVGVSNATRWLICCHSCPKPKECVFVLIWLFVMESSFSIETVDEFQVDRRGIVVGCAIAGTSVFLLAVVIMASVRRHRQRPYRNSYSSGQKPSIAIISQPESSQSFPQPVSVLPEATKSTSNSDLLRSVSQLPSMLLKSASIFTTSTSRSTLATPEMKDQDTKRQSKFKGFYLHPAEVPNWIASSPWMRSPQSMLTKSCATHQAEDKSTEGIYIV